mmetsp:Transcript_16288/g.18763  ORF Transcript_16288/g.18763 Transcript_16288/m.18763 type:complete len:126 (-) Transcript_16288:152-529(-)
MSSSGRKKDHDGTKKFRKNGTSRQEDLISTNRTDDEDVSEFGDRNAHQHSLPVYHPQERRHEHEQVQHPYHKHNGEERYEEKSERCSFACVWKYICDVLVLLLVVAFLVFSGWICYYALNNSGGD